MSDITPDMELDLRGLVCPMPIVRLSQNIGKVDVGGTIRAVATDAGSKADVPAWAKSTGHELLETADLGGEFVFLVRRTK